MVVDHYQHHCTSFVPILLVLVASVDEDVADEDQDFVDTERDWSLVIFQ